MKVHEERHVVKMRCSKTERDVFLTEVRIFFGDKELRKFIQDCDFKDSCPIVATKHQHSITYRYRDCEHIKGE